MVGFDIPFAFVAAGVLRATAPKYESTVAVCWCRCGSTGSRIHGKTPEGLAVFCGPQQLAHWCPGHLCCHRHPVGHFGAWAATASQLVAGFCWLCSPSPPRTWHIGTREEYLAGTAPTLGADFLVFAAPWFIWSGLVLAFCIHRLEVLRRTPSV